MSSAEIEPVTADEEAEVVELIQTEALPVPAQQGLVSFTDRQVEVIRARLGRDFSDDELDFFLAQCRRLELDPFSGQIYAWKDRGRVVTMTSIDGLRVVRDRTGLYAGQLGPQWCDADGEWLLDGQGNARPWLADHPPAAARFAVRRSDAADPIWAIATFDAYGKRHGFWATPGGAAHMLAKCAEAMALRAAFPADLSGIYTDDEMGDRPAAAPQVRVFEQVGADDPDVLDCEETYGQLSEEAAEKIEVWWTEKYGPTTAGAGRPVKRIADEGLREFTGDSPVIVKVAELLERALAADQVAAAEAGIEAQAEYANPVEYHEDPF